MSTEPTRYTTQFYPVNSPGETDKQATPQTDSSAISPQNETQQGSSAGIPVVQMPKGGGAIKGIGEKFQANPVTGTGNVSIPLPVTPGRGGFTPELNLSYDSGSGNSVYGLGWNVGIASISRKTDKGIPRYEDEYESDTFILSGAEDLVRKSGSNGVLLNPETKTIGSTQFKVYKYVPRTEGLFALIERWENVQTRISHWKVTTKENVTTLYGFSESARIYDPDNSVRVFQWMAERSTDNKGNLTEYQYKRENSQNITPSIFEEHRISNGKAFTNTYLKRVKYGNSSMSSNLYTDFTGTWLFELVFDYGEHTGEVPAYNENGRWICRTDPFSTYRAGFEIRTWRLCRRVVMFHNFDQIGTSPVAVKVLTLGHDLRNELTLLTSATLSGIDETNTVESFPPLTFTYSEASIGTELKTVDASDLQNYTAAEGYRWLDLYGEGLSGILLQTPNAWYYKSNLGEKSIYTPPPADGDGLWLSGMKTLADMPSITAGVQVGDLDGNGKTDIQVMDPGVKGFYEINEQGRLDAFRAFKQVPNIDFNDPNLRMLDLTGDGHADILITENNCFSIWYSLAKDGYSAESKLSRPIDEETGPRLLFADANQQVFISDMSGDGLADIVRIRNGSVDYWPNLGYGRFGHKVKMKNSPVFNHIREIEGKRIRLADVDGTGTTDIIYLGTGYVCYYRNQAGNSFGEEIRIDAFPCYDALSQISVMDLLGNGTSCLVNIKKARAGMATSIQYLELTGGIKPFLMLSMNNNMGAVTTLSYKPSTEFYLRDRMAGKPWISKLPFPVHVVEQVVIHDGPSDTDYATRYAYHHGYFDGKEREFRGFGMVEQWDTTHGYDNELMQAPVLTKTWFHTGFFDKHIAISNQYQSEYYSGDQSAWLLEDTALPEELAADELREACRALRGSVLRQEVYGLDNSSRMHHPYTVSEKNYLIRKLQSRGECNKHCVFHVLEQESLAYNYERNAADPRIEHNIVLATDELGNVLQSAAVNYPRRTYQADKPEQNRLLIKYLEASYINQLQNNTFYRHSVPLTQKAYQLHEVTAQGRITKEQLIQWMQQAVTITNHQQPTTGTVSLRVLSDIVMMYYNEGCTGSLPPGQIASHGLPYQTLTLSFANNCIQNLIALNSGNINPLLPTTVNDFTTLLTAGGFLQDATGLRKPGMRIGFDATKFYMPVKQTDQLGNDTLITYDNYCLLAVKSKDALNFETTIENDYLLCQPKKITDPNGSSSLAEYNALGMVIKMAQAGATPQEGDTLSSPTVSYEYNLLNYLNNNQPVSVHVQARDKHGAADTNWLHSYTYSDGLGRELQTKVQAEDGKAWVMQNGAAVQVDNITNRFVATGRKIYNNKGNVIKQYEPWFSDGHLYEPEAQLTQYGVTPIMYYDAPGRLIKTEFPDGTLTRVEFDAWQQKTFDRNDCVNESQWLITMQQGTTSQQRAATLAQAHNNTPQVIDIDPMGRPYQITDDAGNGNKCVTLNHLDIAGLTIMVTDAKGRDMTRHVYDMTGQLCYTFNIDSGCRWMLVNALDKPVHTWDNLQRKTTLHYDALNRPVATLLYNNSTTAVKVESITYGTSAFGYTIGRPVIIRDQSGIIEIADYDFKGNMLSSTRRLCDDYSGIINWNTYTDPTSESFVTAFTFDAMNRPVTETTPDGKVRTYEYNKAGLLEKVRLDSAYFVDNIDYNEKGQRILIDFGNNTTTNYHYDLKNFRLIRLVTTRGDNPTALLQDLNYIYDPEGNIVEQADNAQQTFYFDNSVINPVGKYEYDALYRLVKAQGRELGALGMGNQTDCLIKPLGQNQSVLNNYTQLYAYDNLGNIQSVRSVINPWVRTYQYDTATNRLLNTGAGYNYTYDAHGNMISMPYLTSMEWDYKGNLIKTVGGTVTTYYRYDANGNRVRKIVIKAGGITEERIYSGNYEVFRKKIGGNLDTERQSSFVSDDTKRIAIIDTRTTPSPVEVTIRYQYDNHLGSASLELDNIGDIISYEEYYPFGNTSYRAGRNEIETSLKRYRYVGKERDEETGLYYYGARYYAAWLCRFVSVDPLQFKYPELTSYQYASNRPILMIDIDGLEGAVRDINYMPEAEPYKKKGPLHTTTLKYFEGTFGSGSPKAGIKCNIMSGIATDDAGVTHFTMVTDYTPDEEEKNLYSIGASIGGDFAYLVDNRPTFRRTLVGNSTSLSTTVPTFRMSLGIGLVFNKHGGGFTLGLSAGLLIDKTKSYLKESISLTNEEASSTHSKEGLFWYLANIDYDKENHKYSATVISRDIKYNSYDTQIKVYSIDRIKWESTAYSKKADFIEQESRKR